MAHERQPPPTEPYPFQRSRLYTREQAVAALTSGGDSKELCDGRWVVLPHAILGFLELPELNLEEHHTLDWRPTEDFRVSEDPPTWLPRELRDGSDRARRGVALFIRRDPLMFAYVGRAELSNWPIGGQGPKRAVFTMEAPVMLDPRLPGRLEAELQKVAPRLEEIRLDPAILRRVARGDYEAWGELLEVLYDQGTNYPELGVVTPFLLRVLPESSSPLTEEILWVLASAHDDPVGGSKSAAAAGLDSYLAYVTHLNPEIRRAAVFALRTCDRSRFVELIRSRVRAEEDDRVQASMLTALFVPGETEDLPLFLEVLRTVASPQVRMTAALLAVESGSSLPRDAATYLRQRAWDWMEFESWWQSLDSAGTMPFEPADVLSKHGFFWDDGDGSTVGLLNDLAGLSKQDLIRTLLPAVEVELYECALTAEAAGGAEVALGAIRRWLGEPTSGLLQEEARAAGAHALGLLVGAVATACGRMPDLARKTCLDALIALNPDLRKHVFARIRQGLRG